MRKQVLLCGWYGRHNTGDDALLLACVKTINRIKTSVCINIFVPHGASLPTLPENVVVHAPKRWFRGDRILRYIIITLLSSAVIWGGGSVLWDTNKRCIRSLRFMEFLVWLAKTTNKNIFFWCVGVGPLRTDVGRKIAVRLLNASSMIIVRDNHSYETCKSLNVQAPLVLGFDPAVLLWPSLQRNEGVSSQPQKAIRLGVSLAQSPGTSEKRDLLAAQSYELLVDILARVVEQFSIEIFVIEMCANDTSGDTSACDMLRHRLPRSCSIKVLDYQKEPIDMIKSFGILDAIVAERLHAGIFAFIQAIPFAVVPYHEKCYSFARQIRLPDVACFEEVPSDEELAAFLHAVKENPSSIRPEMTVKSAYQLADEASVKFVHMLDACINEQEMESSSVNSFL